MQGSAAQQSPRNNQRGVNSNLVTETEDFSMAEEEVEQPVHEVNKVYNRVKTYQTHQDRHADKNTFKKFGSKQQIRKPAMRTAMPAKRPMNRFDARN